MEKPIGKSPAYGDMNADELSDLYENNKQHRPAIREYCKNIIGRVFPGLTGMKVTSDYGILLAAIARDVSRGTPDFRGINEYIRIIIHKLTNVKVIKDVTDEMYSCDTVCISNKHNNEISIVFRYPSKPGANMMLPFCELFDKKDKNISDELAFSSSLFVSCLCRMFVRDILPIFIGVKKLIFIGDTSIMWHIPSKTCERMEKLLINADLCDDDYRKIARFTHLKSLSIFAERKFLLHGYLMSLEHLEKITINENVILCPEIKTAKKLRKIKINWSSMDEFEQIIANKLYMFNPAEYDIISRGEYDDKIIISLKKNKK